MRWLVVLLCVLGCGSKETKPADPPSSPAKPADPEPAPKVDPKLDAANHAAVGYRTDLEKLKLETASLDGTVTKVVDTVSAAQNNADRAAARDALAAAIQKHTELAERAKSGRERRGDVYAVLRDARGTAADRELEQMFKDTQEVAEYFEKYVRDLEELGAKLKKANDDLQDAQNTADIADAKAKLDQLRRERDEYMKKQKKGGR
jgi:chromosome segregation ATPase